MSEKVFKRRQGFTKKAAKIGPTTWARTPAARAKIHRAAKRHAKELRERDERKLLR